MKKSQIENLAHTMASSICLSLLNIFKNKDCFEVFKEFSRSRVYENLFDFKTELWHESPDYIIEYYLEEIGETELLKEFRHEK